MAVVMALLWSLPGPVLAAPPDAEKGAVVRAVLFYSPSCPHCHMVMTETLPPLMSAYGSQLQIVAVDVSGAAGGSLYEAAIKQFRVPNERLGVPALFVDGTHLVGSLEIPEDFPPLVAELVAKGGCDWPAIPGLVEALPPIPSTSAGVLLSPPPALPAADSPMTGAIDLAARDPAGSTLSIAVLLGLLVSLAWAGMTLWGSRATLAQAPSALVPVIGIVGLGVAAYLAGVETTGSSAVCGPVGDCNRVHESEYARLFGVLPIGILGCAGYAMILATWAVGRLAYGSLAQWARLGLFALAAFGAVFSAYLTFLEPFVIGATCGWCLASAVAMDAILILATASMWPRRSTRRLPAG